MTGRKKTLHQTAASRTTGDSSEKTSDESSVKKPARKPKSTRKATRKQSKKHAQVQDRPTMEEVDSEQRESGKQRLQDDAARAEAANLTEPTSAEMQAMDAAPMPVSQPNSTKTDTHKSAPLPPPPAPKKRPAQGGSRRRVGEAKQQQKDSDDASKTEGSDINTKSSVPLASVTIVRQNPKRTGTDYDESTTLSFFKAVPEVQGHDNEEIIVNQVIPAMTRSGDDYIFPRKVVRRQSDYGSPSFSAPFKNKHENYAQEEGFLGYEGNAYEHTIRATASENAYEYTTRATASEKLGFERSHSDDGYHLAAGRRAHGGIALAKLSVSENGRPHGSKQDAQDYFKHGSSKAKRDDYRIVRHLVLDDFPGVRDGDYEAIIVDKVVYSTMKSSETDYAFPSLAGRRHEGDYELAQQRVRGGKHLHRANLMSMEGTSFDSDKHEEASTQVNGINQRAAGLKQASIEGGHFGAPDSFAYDRSDYSKDV